MGDASSIDDDPISVKSSHKSNKKKIDLAFLLEKYGPKKKTAIKPITPEPKYYEKGFSVKFKLSHAYKGLEKQEYDVCEPTLEPKPKLSARQLKRLIAASSVQPKPVEVKQIDRLSSDLQKYAEIGQTKREKSNVSLKIAKEELKQNYLGDENVEVKNNSRKIPLSFWKSLSERTGTQKDKVLVETEYQDKTFITNANVECILKTSIKERGNSKKTNKKVRIVTNSDQISGSPKFGRLNKQPTTSHMSEGNYGIGSKAVEEWQKRKKSRKIRKQEQKRKIINAQSHTNSNKNITKSLSNYNTNINYKRNIQKQNVIKRNKSRKARLKSEEELITDPYGSVAQKDTLTSKKEYTPLSNWTKTLHAMYLDVPDTFEEPAIEKIFAKQDKEKAGSVDSKITEEDEEDKEPELQYRPSTFLYGMCNCQKVSRPTTLSKLKTHNKTAGVIQIHGCEGNEKPVECPFCITFPRKRIEAWITDVAQNTNSQVPILQKEIGVGKSC